MTEIILNYNFGEFKDELKKMIEETLKQFPEFDVLEKLYVDRIDDNSGRLGVAYFTKQRTVKIGLRWKPTYHTIAHEIIHILRGRKLIDCPASEFATDVFASSRNELFNDDYCCYIEHSKEIFDKDKDLHRKLMLKGIEYYKTHGKRLWCKFLKTDIEKARGEMITNDN